MNVSVLFLWLTLLLVNGSGLCDLEQEVADMKAQLEGLQRELNELKGITSGPTILTGADGDHEAETTEQTPITFTFPVTVLRVQQENIQDGVRYSVVFNINEPDFEIKWKFLNSSHDATGNMTLIGYNTWKAMWEMTAEEKEQTPYFIVQFNFPLTQEQHSVSFNMDSNDTTEDVVMPHPLKIDTHGDLVYEPGQDIVFKIVRSALSDNGGNYLQGINQYLIEPNTRELVVSDAQQELFEVIDDKNISDTREITVRLKTSTNNITGYFYTHTDTYHGFSDELVKYVVYSSEKKIYPSTQSAPFPPGYIGFFNYAEMHGIGNDDTQMCSLSGPCFIECLVVGDSTVDVQLKLIDLTMHEEVQGGSSSVLGKLGNLKATSSRFEIIRSASPSNLHRTYPYQCQASNDMGHTATKNLELLYFLPGSLLKSESGVSVSTEIDDPRVFIYNISCVVEGFPQPNVTFSIDQWGNWGYDLSPNVTEDLGDFRYRATKLVTYDMDGPYIPEIQGYISVLHSASCTMMQEVGQQNHAYDYYDLEVPYVGPTTSSYRTTTGYK